MRYILNVKSAAGHAKLNQRFSEIVECLTLVDPAVPGVPYCTSPNMKILRSSLPLVSNFRIETEKKLKWSCPWFPLFRTDKIPWLFPDRKMPSYFSRFSSLSGNPVVILRLRTFQLIFFLPLLKYHEGFWFSFLILSWVPAGQLRACKGCKIFSVFKFS